MSVTRYCTRCLTTFAQDAEACPNLGCGVARPAKGWPTLLAPGDVLDRHYYVVKRLATGGAGTTYLARELDASDQPVPPDLAIKVLYAQRDRGPFLRRLATEAQILQELDHVNIVQCLGFVHRAGRPPYLVTRFERGGSLAAHVARVGPLPARVAAAVARQVLSALEEAHGRGVVHRDLKPHNVLLQRNVAVDQVPRVRVADFGIAKVASGLGSVTRIGAFVGTPEFAAPEQFLGLEPTAAADLFATGSLLYYLLTAEVPIRFAHRGDVESCYQELLDALPLRLPDTVEPAFAPRLQAAIDAVMKPEAEHRCTAAELGAALDAVIEDGPPLPQGSEEGPLDVDPAQPGPGGTIVGASATYVFGDEAEPVIEELVTAETRRRMRLRSPEPAPTADPSRRGAPGRVLTLEDLLDFTVVDGDTGSGRPPGLDGPVERFPTAALPARLPQDPTDLLAVLGVAGLDDREVLVEALRDADPSTLAESLRRTPRDAPPALRRGIGLAIGLLEREDLAGVARALLRDADPSVRAGAAEALGVVGKGATLVTLAKVLEDPDPSVRATAALALARACLARGEARQGRSWLAVLDGDPSPEVRRAYLEAVQQLNRR